MYKFEKNDQLIVFFFQWFRLLVVLLYRFVIAAFCFGWMIARAFDEKWYIYLSNWSFFLVTLYFICATMITFVHYRRQRTQGGYNVSDNIEHGVNNPTFKEKEDDTADCTANNDSNNMKICEPSYNLDDRHMSNIRKVSWSANTREGTQTTPMAWFHKAMWVIYNISASGGLLVTTVYWILLFNPDKGIRVFTIIYHGFNSVAMLADTMLTSMPVRLFHVIYPMLLGVVYVLFTVIYWAAGGTDPFSRPYIYPQTDYTGRPVLSSVSQVCLLFIGLPLCQVLTFGFYCLRGWIKTKCGK